MTHKDVETKGTEMERESFVLDAGPADNATNERRIVLDDPLASELQEIEHDLRGAAWSTEGLLSLLHDTWELRDDAERLRIVTLALTQAAALQKLSPRLERFYRGRSGTKRGSRISNVVPGPPSPISIDPPAASTLQRAR